MVSASAQHETGAWQVAIGQAGPSPAPSLWDLLGRDWLPLQRLQVPPGGALQRVDLPGSRYGLSPLVPLGSGLTTAPHHCWSKETSPPLWFFTSVITCANDAVDKPFSPPLSSWLLPPLPHPLSQPPFYHFSNCSPTTQDAFLFPSACF